MGNILKKIKNYFNNEPSLEDIDILLLNFEYKQSIARFEERQRDQKYNNSTFRTISRKCDFR